MRGEVEASRVISGCPQPMRLSCRWVPVLALLLLVVAPLESQAPANVVRVRWSLSASR